MRFTFLLVAMLPLSIGCTPQGDPQLESKGFRDDFEGTTLSNDWRNTGGPYRLDKGELFVQGAYNKPLWLKRVLPKDFRITFVAHSESSAGDIKFEVCGDGVSKAESNSYTASGYVVIFGGWNNSLNTIARQNEHGEDRAIVGGAHVKVQPGHRYQIELIRRGGLLVFSADGQELSRMDDKKPLLGRGHDHFAFNNWASPLYFDKLKIEPLKHP